MVRRGRRRKGGGKLLLAAGAAALLAGAVAGGWWLGQRAVPGGESGRAADSAPAGEEARPGGDTAAAADSSPGPAAAAGLNRVSAAVAPADLPPASPGAKLAIILDDCGQSLAHLDEVLALPFPVTLAILPRQAHSATTAARARAAGKPVMLHQPMEPLAHGSDPAPNPGPGAILAATPPGEIAGLLEANLASAGNPPGFNNHMGSRATADRALMQALMRTAKERNLFFIDSWTSPQSVALAAAQEQGVRSARNQVFLDNQDDYGYVKERLLLAVRKAVPGQEVVAIGHITRQQTWRVLRDAADWLKKSGVALVPASDLAR